ncbi:MAG: ATP-binding protein [Elusimicrobiota bacterium]
MFRERILSKAIYRAVKTFPAVVLTGPRQSGKTTLFKKLFSGTHTFITLEDPDIRVRAKDDPLGFLNQYKLPIVIDEIQYAPELLSYIKTKIDRNRKPGQWFLTGSQNFGLMQNVSQSLAGRAAILSLLPLSLSELSDNTSAAAGISGWLNAFNRRANIKNNCTLDAFMLRGFYPEISLNKKVDRQLWCSSYITTYLERDIRNLSNIGDLNQFERFLISCATRTGQILNLSEIARDIGISVPTAKKWLSMLETGYQIFLLYPYYTNIGKRIVKSPKIYFNDPALCTYLLGLHDKKTITQGPSFGNLFETVIICDFLKRFLNFGEKPAMYYLKTRDNLEIDLVIERDGKIHIFEIKSSMTITPKHASSLIRLKKELGSRIGATGIISNTDTNFTIQQDMQNFSWKNLLLY